MRSGFGGAGLDGVLFCLGAGVMMLIVVSLLVTRFGGADAPGEESTVIGLVGFGLGRTTSGWLSGAVAAGRGFAAVVMG